ncbi:MAG: 50S ribosomal protein L10 [Dehalococcoidia bacterium]|nr:50S ribosomal protein L10 [Dehalococcoidia bacterium]
MPSARNQESFTELKAKFQRSTVVVAADFSGLDVPTLAQFRRKLRENESEFVVAKNTVAGFAAEEAGKAALKDNLKGPTGLVFGYGDPAKCVKVLDEYLKATKINLTVRGGILEKQSISSAGIQQLASLPPHKELMARLAGQLLSGIGRLATVLNAPVQGLATVLDGASKKQGAPSA